LTWLKERGKSLLGGPRTRPLSTASFCPSRRSGLLVTYFSAPTAAKGSRHPAPLLTTCSWAAWKAIRGSDAYFFTMGK